MIICLLGDFSEGLDEGYKNTCHYLSEWLQQDNCSIEYLNIKHVYSPSFWKKLAHINPQVVHLIIQPTNSSLLFTSLMKSQWPDTRVIISALRPEKFFHGEELTDIQAGLLRSAKPDLIVVQSNGARLLFEKYGCRALCLPNGVDTDRFRPVDPDEKNRLRRKYRVEADQPVALHVGHLSKKRNLLALADLPSAGIQVLIAGSTYMGMDAPLVEKLRKSGFNLLVGCQPQIEELYQLADCYLFPVHPGNSLSMPLSVLEAMACNLPVITTRFSGLQEYFQEGNGLFFIQDYDQWVPLVRQALSPSTNCATRTLVSAFSWRSIAGELSAIYSGLALGQY